MLEKWVEQQAEKITILEKLLHGDVKERERPAKKAKLMIMEEPTDDGSPVPTRLIRRRTRAMERRLWRSCLNRTMASDLMSQVQYRMRIGSERATGDLCRASLPSLSHHVNSQSARSSSDMLARESAMRFSDALGPTKALSPS
jgi:hypothetical protein